MVQMRLLAVSLFIESLNKAMRDAEKGTIEQSVKNTERRLRCDESRLTPTPRRSRLPLREKKKHRTAERAFLVQLAFHSQRMPR